MATREDIIRALRSAHAKAEAGGEGAETAKMHAARLAEALENREYDEVSNDAASFVQGAGQGVTLGFSDEIMSGVSALATTLAVDDGDVTPNKRSFFDRLLENYDLSLASTRGDLETARQEDPILSFSGELAGGLFTGGGGGVRAVAGKGLREGAKALAKTGAKYGAAAGYGYSEGDPLSTWSKGDYETAVKEAKIAALDTAGGAGIGAASGFVFPFIAAGARSMGRLVNDAFTPNAKLNDIGRKELLAAYEADIAGGYVTPEDALRELRDVPEMVIGDLGPNLRNEFMRLAQLNTEGAAGIRHFVHARNRGQFDRMFPKLSKALTGKEDNNFARLAADLAKNKKEQADILYGQIEGNKALITDPMREILKNPASRKALTRMNQIRQMEGKKPFDPFDFDKPVTVDEVDSMLRGFDAQLTQLYKANGDIATAFKKNLRDPLKQMIYQNNPELEKAKMFWAGESLNEEAMALGRKIFTEDYRATDLVMDGMSESEKMWHKIGIMQAFNQRMEAKSYDADLIKSIANSRQRERVLETVFDSPDDFNNFMAYLSQEEKMFQTMSEMLSNSNTTRKLLQQNPAVGKRFATQFGYNMALGPNTGPMSIGPRLGAWIAETAEGIVNPEGAALRQATNIADGQSQMLLGKNLDVLKTPNPWMGLYDTGVPQSAARTVPGILATGAPHGEEYGGL